MNKANISIMCKSRVKSNVFPRESCRTSEKICLLKRDTCYIIKNVIITLLLFLIFNFFLCYYFTVV